MAINKINRDIQFREKAVEDPVFKKAIDYLKNNKLETEELTYIIKNIKVLLKDSLIQKCIKDNPKKTKIIYEAIKTCSVSESTLEQLGIIKVDASKIQWLVDRVPFYGEITDEIQQFILTNFKLIKENFRFQNLIRNVENGKDNLIEALRAQNVSKEYFIEAEIVDEEYFNDDEASTEQNVSKEKSAEQAQNPYSASLSDVQPNKPVKDPKNTKTA